MISGQIIQDPIWSFDLVKDHSASKEAETTEIGVDDPPSSSSSESSDSGSDATDADFRDGPVSQPRAWDPDTIMHKNKRNLIAHVVAVGGAESFSCSIRITSEYERIQESHLFGIRRCKKCALATPIKTVGQFASVLKKLRTEK